MKITRLWLLIYSALPPQTHHPIPVQKSTKKHYPFRSTRRFFLLFLPRFYILFIRVFAFVDTFLFNAFALHFQQQSYFTKEHTRKEKVALSFILYPFWKINISLFSQIGKTVENEGILMSLRSDFLPSFRKTHFIFN